MECNPRARRWCVCSCVPEDASLSAVVTERIAPASHSLPRIRYARRSPQKAKGPAHVAILPWRKERDYRKHSHFTSILLIGFEQSLRSQEQGPRVVALLLCWHDATSRTQRQMCRARRLRYRRKFETWPAPPVAPTPKSPPTPSKAAELPSGRFREKALARTLMAPTGRPRSESG